MSGPLKDDAVAAKYAADCKAANVVYEAAKVKAYEIYCKAVDDAYDAAVATQARLEAK
jgi:hypothetical protein